MALGQFSVQVDGGRVSGRDKDSARLITQHLAGVQWIVSRAEER
jgi:hypothetical protein